MEQTFENAERLGLEARAAYRAGELPSAIIRRTFARVPNSIFLIMVFRAAFGLSLPQCKAASAFWGQRGAEDMDDDAMDAYLRPLIDELRSTWDVAAAER